MPRKVCKRCCTLSQVWEKCRCLESKKSEFGWSSTPASSQRQAFKSIDYWVIYWNKAIFDAKGVTYPDSLDGVLEAAKALNDPDNDVYGFVARG